MEYDEREAKQPRWEKGKKQIHWKACFNSAIKLHPNIIFIIWLQIFVRNYFLSHWCAFSWWQFSLVRDNTLFLSLFLNFIFHQKYLQTFVTPKRLSVIFFSNCCFTFLKKKKKSVLFCFVFSPVHSVFH